jgi:opacity protein-like surface antigen
MKETQTKSLKSTEKFAKSKEGSMKPLTVFALLLVIFFAQAPLVSAADSWKHDLQPYLWLPSSVEGPATIEGNPLELDWNSDDVLDLLNFAIQVRYEGRKSNLGLIADLMYVALQGDMAPRAHPTGAIVTVKPDVKQTVFDLAGTYRLEQSGWITDFFGGLRYTYINQQADVVFPAPGPTVSFGGSEDYVEPMFGARIAWILNDKWRVALRGDMSGFGIGNASDKTWNALFGADYKPWETVSVKLGYRIYDIDYSTGSGAERFALDLRAEGPHLGVSFYF